MHDLKFKPISRFIYLKHSSHFIKRWKKHVLYVYKKQYFYKYKGDFYSVTTHRKFIKKNKTFFGRTEFMFPNRTDTMYLPRTKNHDLMYPNPTDILPRTENHELMYPNQTDMIYLPPNTRQS